MPEDVEQPPRGPLPGQLDPPNIDPSIVRAILCRAACNEEKPKTRRNPALSSKTKNRQKAVALSGLYCFTGAAIGFRFNHPEFDQFVAAGLSPHRILQMTALRPAQFLGQE